MKTRDKNFMYQVLCAERLLTEFVYLYKMALHVIKEQELSGAKHATVFYTNREVAGMVEAALISAGYEVSLDWNKECLHVTWD